MEADESSAWSGLTYQKPFAPASTHASPFSNIALDRVDGRWNLYRQPGDNNLQLGDQNSEDRQSFSTLTACENAKLYRIVHECIVVYCGTRGKVSSHSLLNLFHRYIIWKDELPSDLRSVGGEPLPHVMFLQ